MKEKFSLKDALFNKNKVSYLASLFAVVYPQFKSEEFIVQVCQKFLELELKERIVWIAEVLHRHLPENTSEAIKIIIKALPPALDNDKTDNDFGDFIFAPLGEYVVRHGCNKRYLKQSLNALRQITMRFSMEDAIRSFINEFPNETLAALDSWVLDKNYHVRRLVSEGTRPFLPWSKRLTLENTVPIKYLDILYSDRTRYVTRSVANHLNDISKVNPNLVVETLKRWQAEGERSDAEMRWMIKHATRTLVKKGDVDALRLLGYIDSPEIDVIDFCVSSMQITAAEGGMFELSLKLKAKAAANVLIDYGVGFVKANGSRKVKIFKWKQFKLGAGEELEIKKRHVLKADATTFSLYAGEHSVQVQINGVLKNEKFIVVH